MKIFDILKSRWAEAMMVAGLQACCLVMLGDFQHLEEQPPSFGRFFLVGIGIAVFGIISQMLFWGFLRTAAVGGAQSAQPMELLRTGRNYFWKLLIFQLAWFVVFLFLVLMIQSGVSFFLHLEISPEKTPVWLGILSMLAASVVLVKLTYFVPAVMLVQDCGMWEALRRLREFCVLKMGQFLLLFVVVFGVLFAVEYVSSLVDQKHILYYPALAVQAVLSASGMLALFLAAVLEVGRQTPIAKSEEPAENEAK